MNDDFKITGNVVDAVESAVRSIVNISSVTKVTDILHPISLARNVMEKMPYIFLGGEGPTKFAKEQGFQILPQGSLVSS